MKQLTPAEFSLRLVRPPSADAMPVSEVVLASVPTGRKIDGAVLQTALAWNDLLLAFVTDDIPFEDTLRIYLFDRTLSIIDAATLGAAYSTGVFSGLEHLPPSAVRFRFMGSISWRIELLDKPHFAVPFLSDPAGVSRPFSLSRRFKVIGKPLPCR